MHVVLWYKSFGSSDGSSNIRLSLSTSSLSPLSLDFTRTSVACLKAAIPADVASERGFDFDRDVPAWHIMHLSNDTSRFRLRLRTGSILPCSKNGDG